MTGIIRVEQVKETLVSLRGQDVIWASDVAKLYGVETKVINQAVIQKLLGLCTIHKIK
ncbi:MAG: ORF6N domain-containing protein [Bacteroidaceae bacterium]|nr:ORF6N domain-containing protein [Bacteroidaceae bacterium]